MSNQTKPDYYELHQRLVACGKDWSDKDAAASALEETRKSYRAQLASKEIEKGATVSKAEIIAEGSSEYESFVKRMVEARRLANIARVNYDAAKVYIDLYRTHKATERAEIVRI